MAEQQAAAGRAEQLVEELNRCRYHGLEDLDLDLHKKAKVPDEAIPVLKALAEDYRAARDPDLYGRTAAIRRLLRDGLAAYARQGNRPESHFITGLFFDRPGAVRRSPDQRLADTRRAWGLRPTDSTRSFDDYRRRVFHHFATFLLAFVASAVRQPAVAIAAPPTTRPARWPRWLLGGGVGAALLALLVLLLILTHGFGAWLANHPLATPSPSASAGPYASGQTRVEIAGRYGSDTFTDPHSPAELGPHIEAYQQVRVSCKVFAPTIRSISPDGYWYRVASPPWDDRAYAPATNFLNGDSVQGARQHYTDFAVPDCPS